MADTLVIVSKAQYEKAHRMSWPELVAAAERGAVGRVKAGERNGKSQLQIPDLGPNECVFRQGEGRYTNVPSLFKQNW